ncbi:MAG: energy transducer TonB [Candidatus Acidiferrales bacterium]
MNDLGSLSECLVDSDAESLGRAQRLRRKAFFISLVFEATLVAGMLLWPLITPGVLPCQCIITPAPPFHGGGKAAPSHPHDPRPPRPANYRPPRFCTTCAPPIIPPHAPAADGNEPPLFVDDDAGPSGPGLGPDGPGFGSPIPGAGDGGRPIAIPPPAAASTPPVQRSMGVMEASLLRRVLPVYPPIARAAHICGTVELRAIIAKDGTVRELEAASGNPLLVQAALAAVRQWRYRPTLLNREPVEVETHITVKFILE